MRTRFVLLKRYIGINMFKNEMRGIGPFCNNGFLARCRQLNGKRTVGSEYITILRNLLICTEPIWLFDTKS